MAFMQQRKAMYSQRNLVLNSSAVEISEMIVRVAKKYASIMVEEYGIERIHDLVGHIVDVDACYHSDKKIFKENLSRAIILTYENVINSIFKVNKHKSYEFMLELKDKMLNILDVYWIDHISELDGLKRSSSFDKNSDPLKLYGYAANDKFYKDVIPSIYNEMLTYATNPDLKFGDYEIKFSEEAMAEQKIML